MREKAKRRSINVAISPFSPKSHTPFQWDAMEDREALMDKGRRIKFGLKLRKNVSVSYRDSGMTFLETVFARGDRSLSAVILKAWEMGARFDGWDEQFNLEQWMKAAEKVNITFGQFTQEIPEDQELPWSCIDAGVTTQFLLKERQHAVIETTTSDCRSEHCTACGACDTVAPDFVTAVPQQKLSPDDRSKGNVVKKIQEGEIKNYYYRVKYYKDRDVRFLSHRNIVNMFHRAIQTAKIPVAYSQGFHPQPRIAFGPPLAVGVMGSVEVFDLRTIEPILLDFSAINNLMPEGLKISSIVQYDKKPESISASMAAAK